MSEQQTDNGSRAERGAGSDRLEASAAAGSWQDEFHRLEQTAPEWTRMFNDLDPFVAPRKVVEDLLATAPDALARGLVLGIHMTRVQIEACTGRAYQYEAGVSA